MNEAEMITWRYDPLNRDDARVALWEAIGNIKIGNTDDDKLILAELDKLGYWVCKVVKVCAAPTGDFSFCGADSSSWGICPVADCPMKERK